MPIFSKPGGTLIDLNFLESVPGDFIHLKEMVGNFLKLTKDVEFKKVGNIVGEYAKTKNYYAKHLSKVFRNQYQIGSFDKYISACEELIDWCQKLPNCKENRENIKTVVKILSMIQAEKLVLSAKREIGTKSKEDGEIVITITARDDLFLNTIRAFFKNFDVSDTRIFLISATFGDFNYLNKVFNEVKTAQAIPFGTGGDPKNTSAKMLVLADNKKYGACGRNSIYNHRSEICEKIKIIMDEYKGKKIKIITYSAKGANSLKQYMKEYGIEHEVDYYQDSSAMGVQENARILISVSLAHKATNSFDCNTEDEIDSKALLYA